MLGDKVPGVQPMTIVDTGYVVEPEEMRARVKQTFKDHDATLQAYHNVWYNAQHTWHYTQFLGVGLMKAPNDLWAYQDLINLHRPTAIIETGTYQGGSALWFAFLMDMLQIEGGRIFTIDFEDHRRCDHPRITFLAGDSTDPDVCAAIADQIGEDERLLISLDADHSAKHVKAELELYAPLTAKGDWLVVEDTNIAWAGDDGDPGARGGLEAYLWKHQGEFRQDVLLERWLLTMHPGGWLQRIMECPHAQEAGR